MLPIQNGGKIMVDELIYDEIKIENMGIMRSIALIAFGGISYLVGVAGLCVLIFACAGFIPLGAMLNMQPSPMVAVLINIGLLVLFGFQHSLLARPSIKAKLYSRLPKAMERSNYVWSSGVMLALCVLFWQPVSDHVVWQINGPMYWGVLAVSAMGWMYLLAATFAINHWDLFGLRQTWLEAMGLPYTTVPFKEHWMYRYSRHPIMLGVLIGIWCLPVMTANQLMLNIGLSVYMLIGLYFEERDLIRHWGQGYVEYKKRVGALISLPR